MNNKVIFSIVGIALLSFSLIGFGATPEANASSTNRIILPFNTSWENGQPIGLTNSWDYKKDFYGYNGPSNPLPPELGYRNNEVSPPTAFGFPEFGSRQLLAAGYFGASYSYCYFNLFDQTSGSDWGPPFKLKPHTFINIWYYHYQLRDCMIDAQLYNQRTNQWSTLRDFNSGGKYVLDQNNVRIHPAYRTNDPIGSWQFVCFDLSIVWNSDPGNWFVTKIWISFDNGNDHATGQARTYFDMLVISYGTGNATTLTSMERPEYPWKYRPKTSCSVSAWDYHLMPDGNYYLWLKVIASGSNGSYTAPAGNVNTVYPFKLRVSVGQSNAAFEKSPVPTGINLTQPDPNKQKVSEFVTDVLWTLASWNPYGEVVDIANLALKYYNLFLTPEQKPTFEWPEAVTYVNWLPYSKWGVQHAEGEAYVLVPLAPGSRSIPLTFQVDYYGYGGSYLGWYKVASGSVSVNFDWSSNFDPPTSSSPPSVTLTQPSFSQMTMKHSGNPNGNDCNMQVSINSQWPGGSYGLGQTISIRYWGNMWARPGSPGNIMVGVLGIEGEPLNATSPMGPGIYPGKNYDIIFSWTINLPAGNYGLYGIAAAVYTADQAKQQYRDYPSMRFRVGTITVGSSNPIIFLHSPGKTITASANIYPPKYHLLNPQSIGGQTYYAYTWMTDLSGNIIAGGNHGMACTAKLTETEDEGGSFTYNFDVSTLSLNAYYYVNIHSDSTNGQGSTKSTCIYYYNNAPYTPPAPTGSTSGSIYTYTFSARTSDPDGDKLLYQFNFGGGSTWTTPNLVDSFTTVTTSHTFPSMTTYNVTVRAQDSIGVWGGWSAPTTITIH